MGVIGLRLGCGHHVVSLHPCPDVTESTVQQEVGVVTTAEAWCAELMVGCWMVTVGVY